MANLLMERDMEKELWFIIKEFQLSLTEIIFLSNSITSKKLIISSVFIKVSGKMITSMVKESRNLLMVHFTKVILYLIKAFMSMVNQRESEDMHGQMDSFTKDNGSTE